MASPMLSGQDIQRILQEKGNIVQAVILRCPPTSEAVSRSKDDSMNSNDNEAICSVSGKSNANNDLKVKSKEDEDHSLAQKEKPQDGKDAVPSISTDGSTSTAAEPKFSEGTYSQLLEQFIEQVEIDTTPKERAVATLLTGDAAGQITFLGQYEAEDVVVIATRESPSEANDDNDTDTNGDKNSKPLPINPHKLQPPLHKLSGTVRGDILLMRVQPNDEEEEELQDENDSKDEQNGFDEDEKSDTKSDGQESLALDDVVNEVNHKKATVAVEALKKAASEDSLNVSELSAVETSDGNTANTETDITKKENTTEEKHSPVADRPAETTDDADDAEEKTEEEEEEEEEATFFQSYTKEEYLMFAKRTDIPIPADDDKEEVSDQEETEVEGEQGEGDEEGDGDEEEDDEDDEYDPEDDEEMLEESPMGMFHMVLGHLIRQFQEQNGRGPGSSELLRMRALLAERMGIELEGAAAIVLSDEEEGSSEEDASDKDGEASDSSTKDGDGEAAGAQNANSKSQSSASPARVSKKRRREEDEGSEEHDADAVASAAAGPAKKRHRKRIKWNETLCHVQEIPAYYASSDEDDDEETETETETETDVPKGKEESAPAITETLDEAYQLEPDEQEV
jgi:hypothetical protein